MGTALFACFGTVVALIGAVLLFVYVLIPIHRSTYLDSLEDSSVLFFKKHATSFCFRLHF